MVFLEFMYVNVTSLLMESLSQSGCWVIVTCLLFPLGCGRKIFVSSFAEEVQYHCRNVGTKKNILVFVHQTAELEAAKMYINLITLIFRRIQVDWPSDRVSIFGRGKIYIFFLRNVQVDLLPIWSFIRSIYRGLKLTCHILSVSSLRMTKATLPSLRTQGQFDLFVNFAKYSLLSLRVRWSLPISEK